MEIIGFLGYRNLMDIWGTIGTLFVGIIGGASSLVGQHFLKGRERKTKEQVVIRHLALKLAFLFEAYAVDCANKIIDHENADDYHEPGQPPYVGRWIGKVPELPSLPVEDGYNLLDLRLLNDILDFPTKCLMAQDAAMFYEEMTGEIEASTNALKHETVKMGHQAMHIGKALRETYKLVSRDFSYGPFDRGKFLEDQFEKVMAHEERIKEMDEERVEKIKEWRKRNQEKLEHSTKKLP